jgi:hypothetical protein
MADLKLTDLLPAVGLTDDTVFYAAQQGLSVQFSPNIIFDNLNNPVLRKTVSLNGIQLIRDTDVNINISLANTRTEFAVTSFPLNPTLPRGTKDGQLKIITLGRNTAGGSVVLTSDRANIFPGNTRITFSRPGDSAYLMYSSNGITNGWVIVGATPGLDTNLGGGQADVTDERIRRAISAKDGTIIYDRANGTIQVGNISNLLATVNLANLTTDNLREGNLNLYFSNTRARDALSPTITAITKPNSNVLYVSTNGNDLLDGLTPANAIANIHIALNRANAYWTVKVFPGDYTLYDNPKTIKARTSLIGNDLRTTTIRPQNQTQDMFYMNNGAYVNGFTFRGHRAANPSDVRTASAVFSYNPDGSAGIITTSPYIQNCSSITTTGTGIRVDGSYVGGLKSMVLDAFTQYNEGGIGIYLLNEGYMQLVSLFTICCKYGVLCEKGGFGSITNSNTSFGEFGLYCDGVGKPLYRANVFQQIDNRTVDMFVTERPHVNDRVIMASYNKDKCSRDTGLIVDSLLFDLVFTSNTQSIFSGIQYWNQSYTLISDQKTEVLNALEYTRALISNVVVNSSSWIAIPGRPYQLANTQVILSASPGNVTLVANTVSTAIDIFTNGTYGFTDKLIANKYPANSSVVVNNTYNLLRQNRNFIASEVAAYFATVYPYATYLPNRTLFRDIGRIVDSLAFDVLYGGNRQTLTQMASYFYNDPKVTAVGNQKPQTSAAFAFIKTFVDEILTNQTIANTYQKSYTQNTSITGTVTNREVDYVRARIDDLTGIIDNGPDYLNAITNLGTIGFTANTAVGPAANILIANKEFIKAEVIAYVDSNWVDISNGTRNFYTVAESGTVAANGLCRVVFDERILAIDRPLANSKVTFHQGSYLSASGHTFEYVGSGIQTFANVDILGAINTRGSALPLKGGIPIQENEIVELRGGAVYYTSTDHKGDFRIGNELLINRATGTINGRTFNKSLFAVMTPYILAIQ